MFVVFVALLLAATTPTVTLGPKSQAAIAKVQEAFAAIELAQAAMPPPTDDKERLERMFDVDQVGRSAFTHVDWSAVPPDELSAAREAAFNEITEHDLANQAALKSMMPKEGWFLRSKYGAKATLAAFLIVQHAENDPDLMRSVLVKMKPLVPLGEVRGPDYALLFDRVALDFDRKPQRFGSQIGCKDGKAQPRNLEDPDHVDERRKAIGFKDSEAEYLLNFRDMYCGNSK